MNESNHHYNKNLKELARRLRKNSTKAEIKLWKEILRAGTMHGYTFLRQRPVLNFIADFMCKELMLIIEVDGYTHGFEEQWELDVKRQKKLESVGFTILRFGDDEVLSDIKNVQKTIEYGVLNHPPAPPSKGDKSQASKGKRLL
jgi:very-short-patch-repair endonuclease